MARLITERDVRTVLAEDGATADAIAGMEALFREQARRGLTLVPRVQLTSPGDAGPGMMPARSLRLMPCIGHQLGAACVRIYTTATGDAGVATPCEILMLVDLESMALRALIEDHSLHTLRTAAPTAVATRHLARSDARTVAVIGSGRHARGQLAAVASVIQIEQARVFSPDLERRRRYCAEMERSLGVPVRPCRSAKDAVAGADVVIVATATSKPALEGAWLEPGMHINSIAPGELDEAAVSCSSIFPAYTRQLTEGTPTWTPIPQMLASGRLDSAALGTELAAVVAGHAPGRRNTDEITLFLSSGMAGWDLAIALWIEKWAQELGLGVPLPDTLSTGQYDYVCFAPSSARD